MGTVSLAYEKSVLSMIHQFKFYVLLELSSVHLRKNIGVRLFSNISHVMSTYIMIVLNANKPLLLEVVNLLS